MLGSWPRSTSGLWASSSQPAGTRRTDGSGCISCIRSFADVDRARALPRGAGATRARQCRTGRGCAPAGELPTLGLRGRPRQHAVARPGPSLVYPSGERRGRGRVRAPDRTARGAGRSSRRFSEVPAASSVAGPTRGSARRPPSGRACLGTGHGSACATGVEDRTALRPRRVWSRSVAGGRCAAPRSRRRVLARHAEPRTTLLPP